LKAKLLTIAIAIIGIIIGVFYSLPFTFNTQILSEFFSDPIVIISLISAILLQFIGHWIRAMKHKLILQQIRPVRTLEIFKGQTIGSLFNAILPFRLGELVRAHYVARGVSISRAAVFATILFERLIDTLILLVIGIVLLLTIASNNATLLNVVTFLVVISLMLSFLLYSMRAQKKWILKSVHHLSRLFNETIRNKIRMISWSSIYVLKNGIGRHMITSYLYLSLLMWGFYISSTFIFVVTILSKASFEEQLMSATGAYYGVSAPSGPAYLGSFQQIFTGVSNVSMDLLHADNITFLLWALLIIPISILGFWFLLRPQSIERHEKNSDMMAALKNKLYRDVDITKEFSHFLDAYFRGSQLNKILTTEEHRNNFNTIKTFKGGSNALTLLAWQDETMVVKKITLPQYKDKLTAQYEWLKKYDKNPEIAHVLAEYSDNDFYSIDIEYKDEYITFFDYIHSSSYKDSLKVLSDVYDFVNKKLYKPAKQKKSQHMLVKDYLESKVLRKITDASNTNLAISNLLLYEKIVINGEEYENFNIIIDKLNNNKKALNDLATIYESPIHGDLTVDNLIVNPKNMSFILLDPNNENAISDAVVDYAKTMQSLHSGYEFLCTLSSCTVVENSVSFEESRSIQYNKLYEELSSILKKDLTPERYKAVLFHEAVHYCRMLTYRCDINPETAAVFYAIAVRLFNEYIWQYNEK
jgi:preprotein translocase subunit YajC